MKISIYLHSYSQNLKSILTFCVRRYGSLQALWALNGERVRIRYFLIHCSNLVGVYLGGEEVIQRSQKTYAVSIAVIYPKFPFTLNFIGIQTKPLYMEKSLKISNPSDFTSNFKSF